MAVVPEAILCCPSSKTCRNVSEITWKAWPWQKRPASCESSKSLSMILYVLLSSKPCCLFQSDNVSYLDSSWSFKCRCHGWIWVTSSQTFRTSFRLCRSIMERPGNKNSQAHMICSHFDTVNIWPHRQLPYITPLLQLLIASPGPASS